MAKPSVRAEVLTSAYHQCSAVVLLGNLTALTSAVMLASTYLKHSGCRVSDLRFPRRKEILLSAFWRRRRNKLVVDQDIEGLRSRLFGHHGKLLKCALRRSEIGCTTQQNLSQRFRAGSNRSQTSFFLWNEISIQVQISAACSQVDCAQ